MIAMIYMAAGNSRRFGDSNKLLQNWQGKPLYRHTFDRLLRIMEKDPENRILTVVTQYPEIFQEVQKNQNVQAVFCEESRLGISYTIKAGIREIQRTASWKNLSQDYLMFVVADQPNLSEKSIESLIQTANQNDRRQGEETAFSLRCNGKVGNPCMFPAELIPELMQLQGDQGGRAVLKKHPCWYVEIEDPEEFSDIDTEEQYQRQKKIQEKNQT